MSVPALPGCISEGKDREEALKSISVVLERSLEVLNGDGKTAP